ncbi:hypothetical protein DH2020_014162 [Rehmannia glutinosa]|uniref:Elongation factor Ts, mitochondrial n=1 Tax=Rehmannia glutinosa TaxID=99300 RepID=A0ABR0WYP7_REHGL
MGTRTGRAPGRASMRKAEQMRLGMAMGQAPEKGGRHRRTESRGLFIISGENSSATSVFASPELRHPPEPSHPRRSCATAGRAKPMRTLRLAPQAPGGFAPLITVLVTDLSTAEERTSAPIKEVKSALVACNWDIEAAQKDLRKRGVALASKKSSRTAAEGLLALAQNQKKAVVVELNCETDFVARNDIFQYLALSLAKTALLLEGSSQASVAIPVGPESLGGLKMNFDHPKLSGERTVENAITEVAAMMGENVKLGGGIGRIAGLLSLEVEDEVASLDAVQRVGSELAMHVVAAKPLFLTKEDVASDALANERDILRSQAESTGKTQMAIDKMVEGRLRKYYEEVVLLEQKFIVDDTLNIKEDNRVEITEAFKALFSFQGTLSCYCGVAVALCDITGLMTLLNNLSKEVGSTVKIGNFLRVEVGEGLKRLEAVSGTEPVSQAA